MIKSIGEMRTRITIRRIISKIDSEGYNTREYRDVFSKPVWCKWEWERGTETFENERQRLEERAVITMRYSDKVDVRCLIWKDAETEQWDVIAVNDVDERHKWMRVTLKRSVKA